MLVIIRRGNRANPCGGGMPKDANSLLRGSVLNCDPVMLRIALKRGAEPDVDVPSPNGEVAYTPLAIAILAGALSFTISTSAGHAARRLECVRLLLEAKADPNLPTPFDVPLLSLAAAKPDPDVVELLLRYGADRNRPKPLNHKTPLADCRDFLATFGESVSDEVRGKFESIIGMLEGCSYVSRRAQAPLCRAGFRFPKRPQPATCCGHSDNHRWGFSPARSFPLPAVG